MGQNKEEERPLVGWKQIAVHLDVCVETAQKYLRGAPIFKMGDQKVAIYPGTLKKWQEKQES